jgi:hypothetical protein
MKPAPRVKDDIGLYWHPTPRCEFVSPDGIRCIRVDEHNGRHITRHPVNLGEHVYWNRTE